MASRTRPMLAPLAAAYGALGRARRAMYRAGLLKVHEVGRPVVSVGNLTAGGTGKTPLVERLARALASDEGLRACVLTRGYGRRDAGRRVVVSDGRRVLAGALAGGDEPRLLAERLLRDGVAVVCDADRVAAARWAVENLNSEVFILDDGFQHLRIARDLNVLTLDATDPWGGGRLLPAGLLREPPSEAARADCVIITRAELCADIAGLKDEAARLTGGRPVFVARTVARGLRELSGSEHESSDSEQESSDSERGASGAGLESTAEPSSTPSAAALGSQSAVSGGRQTAALSGSQTVGPVFAFCAVGNPRAFFENLRREGFDVRGRRAFADHHFYTRPEAVELSRAAERAGARALVTTAKDAVKLRGLRFDVPCLVLEIGLEIDGEAALLALLRRAAKRA